MTLMTAEKRLMGAALKWWSGRRPLSFCLTEHLANPTINTVTLREHALAKAAALYIVARQNGQLRHKMTSK